MGTSYSLFRLASWPLPHSGPAPEQLLPLGPPGEVLRRLLAIPGMSRARGAVAEDAERDWLVLERDGGHVEYCYSRHLAESLSVSHAAAWDLLEPASVLGGPGVLAVLDAQTGDWYRLEELAARPPTPVRGDVRVSPAEATGSAAPLAVQWTARIADARVPLEVHPTPEALAVVAWDRVLVLDAHTGQERWAARVGRPSLLTAVTDGLFLVGGDEPCVYALDLCTGAQRWKVALRGRTCARPWPLPDGRVVFATQAGQLTCVSTADGHVQWQVEYEGLMPMSALHVGDALLVGGNADPLLLLDAQTGRLRGERAVSALLPPGGGPHEPPCASALVSIEGRVFVSNNFALAEVRLPSLSPGLQLRPGGAITVHALGGRLSLVTTERLAPTASPASGRWRQQLRVLDVPSLSVRWERTFPGQALVPREVQGGWVLLETANVSQARGPLTLLLVDPEDGSVRHTLALGEASPVGAALLAHGEQLLVAADGALRSVDVRRG